MEPKVYFIPCLPPDMAPEDVDWNCVPAAAIDSYAWLDGGYEPTAEARLAFLPRVGFVLRMSCAETDPKMVYHAYNDPVYTDSCLEFFAAWVEGDPRYMNMEMNAAGTLLSCLGASRQGRIPLADLTGGVIPRVTGFIAPDRWHVTSLIPLNLLAQAYGVHPDIFVPGYSFAGNFYKCGDETPIPHYGMWNPVGTEKPDFHRPEFFGRFVIEK